MLFSCYLFKTEYGFNKYFEELYGFVSMSFLLNENIKSVIVQKIKEIYSILNILKG